MQPLFILIGSSAAGKTTVIEGLLADPTLDLVRFLTTTSRAPREGEADGVQYHFLSTAEFRADIEREAFFEWVEIYDNFYGTNKQKLTELRNGSRPIICSLEFEGAKKIKESFPTDTIIILIEASRETMITRLEARHMDPADLAKRIEHIDREMTTYPTLADVRIQNNDGELDLTLQKIARIITEKTA